MCWYEYRKLVYIIIIMKRKKKKLIIQIWIVESNRVMICEWPHTTAPQPPTPAIMGKDLFIYILYYGRKDWVTGNFTDWSKERNNPKNEIVIVLKNLLHFLYTSIIFDSDRVLSVPPITLSLVWFKKTGVCMAAEIFETVTKIWLRSGLSIIG